MNKVFFNGFGIELNVPQIAFKIGNLPIYYYSICIVSGILLSLILATISKEKFKIKFEDLLEIFVFSLISGIVGARLYYCIFNIEYFKANPSQIFAIRNGGLAIYGGIIFGVLTSGILSKIKKVNFKDLLDYIAPYLALTQAIGRFGNFFNVEAYGIETKNIFRMGILKDEIFTEVHPCFLYESFACALIFLFLRFIQKKRKFEFQVFADYMIFYGIARFFIEALRSDSLYLGCIKVSQLVSVLLVAFGVIVHISKAQKKSNFVNRNMD